MNLDQLHIMQHALGLDEHGQGRSYRNHFVTGEGSTDYPHCMALTEAGLMTRRPCPFGGRDSVFHVTDAGRKHVSEHSPPPPKLTRSQRRYQDFLDADCGYSFREWLLGSKA